MTASRARGVAGLLLLALLIGDGARAAAQGLAQGGPIQLIPLKPSSEIPEQGLTTKAQSPEQPAPKSLTGPQGPSPTPVNSPPLGPSSQPAPQGIEVDTLGGLDNDALGALDPGQGGFGLDLWRGTPRATVAALIAALPVAIPSPALRDLAHRALLSRANPPRTADSDGGNVTHASLISLRAQKLAAMGDLQGLKALSAVIPASLDDEALARMRAEASLVDGTPAAVCSDASTLIKKYPGAYWQKLQLFCEANEKKVQQVDVGVALLHEEGEDKDPIFFTLLDALMGNKTTKLSSLPAATPLHFAMMRAAKMPVPEDALRSAEPAVLRAIAQSPNASADLRVAAAERATLVGALSGDDLARIYDKVSVSEGELAEALSKAQKDYGPRARVLLYRAAKTQSVPTAKAGALAASLSLARSAGVYQLALAANLPLVKELTPSAELAFFAPEAGRALFCAGQMDSAQGWMTLARQKTAANAQAIDSAVDLWPYAHLAAPGANPWDESRFAAWQAAQKAAQEGDAKLADERAARLLGLFSALGDSASASAWRGLSIAGESERATMPPLAVWQGLKDAAAGGRRGETVLLALVAIGAGGAENANPVALDAVIESLRKVGLESDARRLAIEAAVAAGV